MKALFEYRGPRRLTTDQSGYRAECEHNFDQAQRRVQAANIDFARADDTLARHWKTFQDAEVRRG